MRFAWRTVVTDLSRGKSEPIRGVDWIASGRQIPHGLPPANEEAAGVTGVTGVDDLLEQLGPWQGTRGAPGTSPPPDTELA